MTAGARDACTWCRGPIPDGKRRDALTCSKACRQAAHRFRIGRAEQLDGAERPMRFAYADPPYPGLARKYYGCAEVDHAELVARLVGDFPDGWALSTSAASARDVLLLCPPATRVCPWVRGARPGANHRPGRNAWEPLLVVGGRLRREAVAEDLDDVLVWGGRQHSHPDALVGMKPAAFCEWMFRLLGARQGDELVDLFPGSGAIGRAWEIYTSREYSMDASRPTRPADASRPTSPEASSDMSPAAAADASRRARAGRIPSRLAGAVRRLATWTERHVAPRAETDEVVPAGATEDGRR